MLPGTIEAYTPPTLAIPMQHAATDEEGAGLIASLGSPMAESITDQSINIDGGMVMW